MSFICKLTNPEPILQTASFLWLLHCRRQYSCALSIPEPDNWREPCSPEPTEIMHANYPILNLLPLPCLAFPTETTIKACAHAFLLLLCPLTNPGASPCGPVWCAVAPISRNLWAKENYSFMVVIPMSACLIRPDWNKFWVPFWALVHACACVHVHARMQIYTSLQCLENRLKLTFLSSNFLLEGLSF